MAAATTTTNHTLASMNRALQRVINRRVSVPSKNHHKVYITDTVTTIAGNLDDAGDKIQFFYFPDGFKLTYLKLDYEELDSHATTPTLDLDLIVTDSAAVETKLIDSINAPEAVGSDELDLVDSSGVGIARPIDVGGKVLELDVVTGAATEVVGADVFVYAEGFIESGKTNEYEGIVL